MEHVNITRIESIWYVAFCRNVVVISGSLKAVLGFVQTNMRTQWNPVYKAFHRIHLWKRTDWFVVIQT